MNDKKEHPINDIFEMYPDYCPEWIEYAFLRWCHPLGNLAWTSGYQKAIDKDVSWISWLQYGCLQLMQKEEAFVDFAKQSLERFLQRKQI